MRRDGRVDFHAQVPAVFRVAKAVALRIQGEWRSRGSTLEIRRLRHEPGGARSRDGFAEASRRRVRATASSDDSDAVVRPRDGPGVALARAARPRGERAFTAGANLRPGRRLVHSEWTWQRVGDETCHAYPRVCVSIIIPFVIIQRNNTIYFRANDSLIPRLRCAINWFAINWSNYNHVSSKRSASPALNRRSSILRLPRSDSTPWSL